MWIEDLPNGKYKYCERYTDTKGMLRKVSVTLDKNSSRAQNEASRLLYNKIDAKIEKEKKKINDEQTKLASITFWEVQDEYFSIYEETVKAKTASLRETAKKKIRSLISEKTLLSDVDSVFILEILEKLYYQENYSYSYVKTIKASFNMVLDYAISKKYITVNPISNVRIKKKTQTLEQREKKKEKYLERSELKQVIKDMAVIDKSTSLLIEFMSLTGLRFGECVAIQKKNIENNILHVNGTWDSVSNSKTTTKNIYSDRKITLPKRCVQIIEEYPLKYPNDKISNDNYIFIYKNHKPYSLSVVNSRLKKINSSKNLSTHIFRHTHIALLTELGIPLKSIMERVGHNNPQTTLSIYSHVTEEMSKNIIEKLNEIDLLN
ncbi:site-specific integrase [Lactococcus taiwanensis]|uniref:Site-specific integrase n=1 Tax=Lactococcus taiwanensis TaxID=1151742 RepID=A0AA45KFD9_9LACT|nr:site-specific integrase [Lactococcus taiwanensis]QSE76345.1 site-specific integrase [Lactococcus taiwanensis]